MQKPVIVVGGGLAGLASACYLARGGRSVTLLEKSHALGGRASTDHLQGFALNRGAHALYTGGAASEVLHDLGVTYHAGVPKQIYGLDARGIHRFPASTVGLLTTTLLDGGDKREFASFFVRLGTIAPEAHAHESVADWISSVARRPRMRHLLTGLARVQTYSSALDVIAADALIARLKQAISHPVHYVSGGWQTLVDGLHDAAMRAGVDVRTTSGVERVTIVEGLATSVRLQDGQQVPADQVVLAVPPEDALRLLGDDTAPHLARSVAGMAPAYVAALDVALRALPNPRHPVVFDLEQPRFLTAQSTVADVAPRGGAVIHTFTQPDFRVPTKPAEDRAALEDLLDQVQPGWRELVVEQRFLPRMLGSSTLPLMHQGSLAGRPAHHSPDVRNVYFAGDWVGPRGYLADASLDSARKTARQVLDSARPVRRAA